MVRKEDIEKLVNGFLVSDGNGGYFYKNGSDYDFRHFFWVGIDKEYWEEERVHIEDLKKNGREK
jgi:hypothetical protein